MLPADVVYREFLRRAIEIQSRALAPGEEVGKRKAAPTARKTLGRKVEAETLQFGGFERDDGVLKGLRAQSADVETDRDIADLARDFIADTSWV